MQSRTPSSRSAVVRVGERRAVQLLRQQSGGARRRRSRRSGCTAVRRRSSRAADVVARRDEHAVHRLGQPDLVRRQGATGHAAAGDQAQRRAAVTAGRRDERRERRADRRADVAGSLDAAARDRHDAREAWARPCVAQRATAAAVATFWQITPASAGRPPDGTSIAGDRRDQLTLGALRIHRGDDRERRLPVVTLALRCAAARPRWLRACRPRSRSRTRPAPQRVQQDACAEHDVVRGGSHQRVVAADPRLALGAVQHERARAARACRRELGRGRKRRRRRVRRCRRRAGVRTSSSGLQRRRHRRRARTPGRRCAPSRRSRSRCSAVTALDRGLARLDRDDACRRSARAARLANGWSARATSVPDGHRVADCHDGFGAVPGALVERERPLVGGGGSLDDRRAARLLLVRVECEAGRKRGSRGHHAARGWR